jgi:predicted transcriptional regulator/major membrane immunogen (membrane-anchored lipoprotein)/sulfur transfer protein SufE
MSYQKNVGNKSDFFKRLWVIIIVYLLLITALFAVSQSALANNPPVIEIVEPGPGETLSGNVTIWMVASDADGNDDIEEVWVKIDGGSLLNATYNHTDAEGQWWFYIWDTTTVTDGWHHITAIAFDGIDEGTHTIEVFVDNIPENNPPHVEILEPGHGETVSGNVTIWMLAWDADGNDDIQDVWVEIDDLGLNNATYNHTTVEGQWWYYIWDTTTVSDGWHHITAYVSDGIDEGHDIIEIIVDNLIENNPPHIEIMEPGHGETISGIVTIWMLAWDADGNDDIQDVWVKIDGGDLLNATYNHTDHEGQWWYFEWDTTSVEDGWHSITAVVWDGTDDASDIIEVFVDNIPENNPPHVEILEPGHGETVSGNITIWMLAWDADGNDDIEEVWVRIDGGDLLNATYNHTDHEGQWWYFVWDTTTVEDGWHSITAVVWDGIDDGHDVIEVKVENHPANSPPHVEIMEPSNGETVSGVIEILLRAWDSDGKEDVETVYVKIDDGTWHEATFVGYEGDYSRWIFEWDTTTVDDGEHHIHARAWDGEEYSEIDTIYVIVDNEPENHPPAVEIMEPSDGDTVSGVIEIVLLAWDPDGPEDIDQVWVKIDHGLWHEATFVEINHEGSWWVIEWDTTTVGDGWHHIYAKATDGELWADDHIEVYVNNFVENHPPYIEIMEPENGETVHGTVVIWMLAWDADGLDDIENVWVQIDDGPLQDATFHHIDGRGSWWVFEWDTTTVDDGWHAITAIVSDGIDEDDDVIEVYVLNHPHNNPPHVEIMEPDNGETVSGVIEIWLRAWDLDGREDVEAVFVKIDEGSWHEATFSGYDGDYSWWVFEWDTTEVEDGEHHIYARAWDGEEYSDMDVIFVIVDNEHENHPPHVEIVEPENGETVSGVVEIWLRAWDLDGNDDIEAVFVKIDEGGWHEATFVEMGGDFSWWVFEWDTTTVDDGEHHISAKAWDGKEYSEIDIIWVMVNNEGENHPPAIEIMEPEGGSTVSGTVEILLLAWDPDDLEEIQHVWVKIDSGSWHEATFLEINHEGSWWVFEWDTTTVDDGWHHIFAKTTDGEFWADDVIEVYVDNEVENHPPQIEIITPEHGSSVSGIVTIWMVAWDLDGNEQIEDVWVRFDGGPLHNATYNHTDHEGQWWYFEWDTGTVGDGWHSIRASVFDGIDDGHDIIEVFVDNFPENNPPHVEIMEPGHGETVHGTVEIRLRAWDLDGKEDVEAVFVRINGGAWEEATFIRYEGDYSWWVFEWDTTTDKDGEHHIYAKAWDGQEHSEEEVIMVMVDNSEGEEPWLSGLLPLILLAGLLLGAALILGGTEVGIMAVMGLIFLPLYTKLSKKDVLDHFVRGQIFGYIKINPGDNYSTIKKNLELNNGTLTYHLNVLEKEGLIKSWTNGSHKYFYPQGVKIPGNGVKNPSIHDAILKSIQDSPGITVSDIAAINGISKQLANYHIRKMAAEGTIELERKSLSKVCYPKSTS